jgi:hypothetical protein
MIEQKIPGSIHKADMPDGCARAVEIGYRDVIQPSKTGGRCHALRIFGRRVGHYQTDIAEQDARRPARG